MNDYKQALELSERLKQTYMDEEQQATLSIFCDQVWNEVNGDYDTACTQSNIINVLQHYVDTGLALIVNSPKSLLTFKGLNEFNVISPV